VKAFVSSFSLFRNVKMNLLTQGLAIQASIVTANLTDADVANIHKAGLRLVNRPDIKNNVVSLDERRVMQSHTSPEAA
jgi:hypothetical protein